MNRCRLTIEFPHPRMKVVPGKDKNGKAFFVASGKAHGIGRHHEPHHWRAEGNAGPMASRNSLVSILVDVDNLKADPIRGTVLKVGLGWVIAFMNLPVAP